MASILAHGDGATATAVGRRVTVTVNAAKRDAARGGRSARARRTRRRASQQAVARYSRKSDAARCSRDCRRTARDPRVAHGVHRPRARCTGNRSRSCRVSRSNWRPPRPQVSRSPRSTRNWPRVSRRRSSEAPGDAPTPSSSAPRRRPGAAKRPHASRPTRRSADHPCAGGGDRSRDRDRIRCRHRSGHRRPGARRRRVPRRRAPAPPCRGVTRSGVAVKCGATRDPSDSRWPSRYVAADVDLAGEAAALGIRPACATRLPGSLTERSGRRRTACLNRRPVPSTWSTRKPSRSSKLSTSRKGPTPAGTFPPVPQPEPVREHDGSLP